MVTEMRDNLLSIAADIESLNKVKKEQGKQQSLVQSPEVADISKYVGNILDKVPVVKSYEKRLDIMKGLDPLMDGIIQRMNQVTDNSHLRELQAIEKSDKAVDKLVDANRKVDNLLNKSKAMEAVSSAVGSMVGDVARDNVVGVVRSPRMIVHAPRRPVILPISKDAAINNVVRRTLSKIEQQSTNSIEELHGKVAAIDTLRNAALHGKFNKNAHDATTPDVNINHETIVDHGSLFHPPHVVSRETQVVKNVPRTSVVTNAHDPLVAAGVVAPTVASIGGSREVSHTKTIAPPAPVTAVVAGTLPVMLNADQVAKGPLMVLP